MSQLAVTAGRELMRCNASTQGQESDSAQHKGLADGALTTPEDEVLSDATANHWRQKTLRQLHRIEHTVGGRQLICTTLARHTFEAVSQSLPEDLSRSS